MINCAPQSCPVSLVADRLAHLHFLDHRPGEISRTAGTSLIDKMKCNFKL